MRLFKICFLILFFVGCSNSQKSPEEIVESYLPKGAKNIVILNKTNYNFDAIFELEIDGKDHKFLIINKFKKLAITEISE